MNYPDLSQKRLLSSDKMGYYRKNGVDRQADRQTEGEREEERGKQTEGENVEERGKQTY